MVEARLVNIGEINSCPALRLDVEHYLPVHRTWECKHGDTLRTRGAIARAWSDGKITSKAFKLTMKYV